MEEIPTCLEQGLGKTPVTVLTFALRPLGIHIKLQDVGKKRMMVIFPEQQVYIKSERQGVITEDRATEGS